MRPSKNPSNWLRSALLGCALLLPAAGVLASSITWRQLSSTEKIVLAPLQDSWEQIDDRGHAKWREVARLYPKMTHDEQLRVQGQMRQWAALTPEQRRAAREQYLAHARLAPEQRDEVITKWKEFSSLPPEKRKELAGTGDAETSGGASAPPESGSTAASVAGSETSSGSSSAAR